MLSTQQKIQFSSCSGLYDIIVPKDNLLRKINDLIDFSFIYDELLEKYCSTNGRTAESPIKMFKYLLLKTIYTVSDVDVVERSRYDMSFKYFLEMPPRGGCDQFQFPHQVPQAEVKGHGSFEPVDQQYRINCFGERNY